MNFEIISDTPAIFMPRTCLQITKMSIYGVVFGWINANFARRIAFSKEKACVVHLIHLFYNHVTTS
jgi:hypothetical protein